MVLQNAALQPGHGQTPNIGRLADSEIALCLCVVVILPSISIVSRTACRFAAVSLIADKGIVSCRSTFVKYIIVNLCACDLRKGESHDNSASCCPFEAQAGTRMPGSRVTPRARWIIR